MNGAWHIIPSWRLKVVARRGKQLLALVESGGQWGLPVGAPLSPVVQQECQWPIEQQGRSALCRLVRRSGKKGPGDDVPADHRWVEVVSEAAFQYPFDATNDRAGCGRVAWDAQTGHGQCCAKTFLTYMNGLGYTADQ